MSFSGNPGEMKGWNLMVPWKYFPWTTCWPVRSGLLIPSSTTGRNLLPITWQHPTSCCAWWTMAPSCTPWGKFGSPGPGSSRSLYTGRQGWDLKVCYSRVCVDFHWLLAHLSLILLLSLLSLFPAYVASLILNLSTFLQVAFFSSFMLIFFLLCNEVEVGIYSLWSWCATRLILVPDLWWDMKSGFQYW